MPRRTKEAPGRVTPKADARRQGTDMATASGRYTAPLPADYRHSSWWVPAFMLAFFGCGILMIVLNYISLLPGAPSNWYLLGGLGLIVCGFAISTQYR
jgi:Cell division protein CrgA